MVFLLVVILKLNQLGYQLAAALTEVLLDLPLVS